MDDFARGREFLCEQDDRWRQLVHKLGDRALDARREGLLWHSLMRSIIYQQLSGKAASTIYHRVLDLFAGDPPDADALLACDPGQLRACGVSVNKWLALQDLARHVSSGMIPDYEQCDDLSDDEIVEKLTVVRGIGPWSVQMMLMFQLGRPDVLPCTDLGVRKGFARFFNMDELPTPAALQETAETWRPWRTVASWYLWRLLEVDHV